MKLFRHGLTAMVATASVALLAGCGKREYMEPASSTPEPAAHTAGDDHGHEHGDGDHSHDHAHGVGPHNGTLADWGGGEYHVEFTVDHEKKEAVVYILGSDEKSPVPIRADSVLLSIKEPVFQVGLSPQPLAGEEEGTSSRFAGTHEKLGTVREFSGTISAELEGTPYVADFAETPHGAHEGSQSQD